MREIARTFSKLRARGEGALIAYVTAGDPEPDSTPRIVEALAKGGADIVELGIPFSDPIADGPTIQAASVRALKAETTPRIVLKKAEEIRSTLEVPIVLMTYFNPILRMGLAAFFESASACGVDGIIIPDLPIEEAGEYKKFAEVHHVDTIFLAAPSTSPERLRRISDCTSGFLYLVSVYGVTGTRERLQEHVKRMIRTSLQVTSTEKTPLAVGFGISKPEHVRTIINNRADAAIVGSGFVKIIERKHKDEREMLRSIKEYASVLKNATKKDLRKRMTRAGFKPNPS